MMGSRTIGNETGAILPIFALMLFVLLGFAALTVDLGLAWAERREAQTAADAGALGAALQYLVATPDEDGIFDLVDTYVNSNITRVPFTFDEWDDCADPGRPAGYAALGDSGTWDSPLGGGVVDVIDCISIKQPGAEPAVLRVKLPVQDVPTFFARVIGFNSVSVSAFAEAEILINEASDILPFSLPSNPSTEECLGTPPSGQLPPDLAPCTGPVSGNFGMLDVWWFGADDETHNTLGSGCPSKPPFTVRSPYNLSVGIDHPITEWPDIDGDPDHYDGPPVGTNLPNNHPAAESCDSAANDVIPYVVQTETGNTVTVLEDGFFGPGPYGTTGAAGRLRQASPTLPASQLPLISDEGERLTFSESTGSYTIDNIGMWEYLNQAEIDPTSECSSNTFNGPSAFGPGELAGRELTDQMEICLDSGDAVFIDEILESPRFAVVPKMNYIDGDQAGTEWWAIMKMVPVYIQATWFECKSPTTDCRFEPTGFDLAGGTDGLSVFHHPGEGSSPPCLQKKEGDPCDPPGTISAMGVSAFVINSNWLSEEAQNSLGKPQPYEVYLKR